MSSNFDNPSQVRVQFKHKAMGGEFVFLAYPQKYKSKEDVLSLFNQAAKEVDRIESKFTDFRESPFNQINDYAISKAYQVDDETFALLQIAMNFSIKTDGLFDISFATLAHRQRSQKLSQDQISYYKSLIDYKKIKLDPNKKTIRFLNKDIRIGFGGIGKGYAVDRAFEILKDADLVNFSVNGSGDMRVHSAPDAPRPWRLGIRNPFAKDPTQAAGLVQLANGALVTSGSYVQGAHIINTGVSNTNELISVTLIDDNALNADVLATALMNLTAQEAIAFLDQENRIGLGIDKSGKTHLSKAAITHFSL